MTTTGAVHAIGALADPIRRRLYDYVASQHDAVSREEAAESLGLPLTKTKFHLERLAREGLLDVEYRRISGRQGPGAGRPSKLYRRSKAEVSVSLPERRYDLMGVILAGAVVRNQQGERLQPAIEAVAYEQGTRAAQSTEDQVQVVEDPGTQSKNAESAAANGMELSQGHFARANTVLTQLGYESERSAAGGYDSANPLDSATRLGPSGPSGESPQPRGAHALPAPAAPQPQELRLRNCPFDALAQEHRDLVCGTNQHFVQGVLDGAGCNTLRADLEPHSGYCCVVVRDGSISDNCDTGCCGSGPA